MGKMPGGMTNLHDYGAHRMSKYQVSGLTLKPTCTRPIMVTILLPHAVFEYCKEVSSF